MSDFHFLRPYFLLLLFLLYFVWRPCRSDSPWISICSKELHGYVIRKNGVGINLLPWLLSLLIIALAGPSWELKPQPLLKSQSGLVIALDLSPSMYAQDIKPSRLQRALYKISDLLDQRKEGQTALIVFSEDPYVVTPLTDDIETIKSLLNVLDPTIMPSYGHRIDKAIEKANSLLSQGGITDGSILVLTAEMSEQELEKSSTENKISILGVGTDLGAPIPHPKEGFLKEKNGAVVVSKLQEGPMKKLANDSHGIFVPIRSDDSDVAMLLSHFSGMEQSHIATSYVKDGWQDSGYWFVLASLPLALLVFRKSALFLLFLLPGLLQGHADTEAEKLFREGNFEQAKEIFQDPDWKAAASYRLGDYKTAVALYEQNRTADGFYNLGNAQAMLGDYKSALDAYVKALEIDPDHEDALYNKKIIEELMKKEEEEKEPEQDQKEQKQDQKEQQQDQNEKKQDQKEPQPQAEPMASEKSEQQQIDDKWLDKVVDDPGALLRRKFLQQYRKKL